MIEALGLALLRRLDPERAHALALAALRAGLVPLAGAVTSPRLAVELAGLRLPNPVGLAAGFDKNAVALMPLSRAGFGFLEVGAATPLAQPGNPRPRLFRLPADGAVINRFGFNNDGAAAIAARLADRPRSAVIGLNLGANKDSRNPAADFAAVLTRCGPHVDFATVNVSSPNTPGLRDLQGAAELADLLGHVAEARRALARPVPLFLKIAPDLTEPHLVAIAGVARAAGIDAIVATNTTIGRGGVKSASKSQPGGLSGSPLFERSTRVLAILSSVTAGTMPLIGVGGIATAADAYAKIRAGATAVQLYTALTFHGLGRAAVIARGLDALLLRNGHASVTLAIGTDRNRWL